MTSSCISLTPITLRRKCRLLICFTSPHPRTCHRGPSRRRRSIEADKRSSSHNRPARPDTALHEFFLDKRCPRAGHVAAPNVEREAVVNTCSAMASAINESGRINRDAVSALRKQLGSWKKPASPPRPSCRDSLMYQDPTAKCRLPGMPLRAIADKSRYS